MEFDYGESHGPHTWCLKFPSAAGPHQSPINLVDKRINVDKSLKPVSINLTGIEQQKIIRGPHNFRVVSHGFGTLRGGPLPAQYIFEQFHFHWGSGDHFGSEHLINGISAPAELHCVFANTSYTTTEGLLDHRDGLSVVGVFLQIGPNPNNALEILLNKVDGMKPGEEKTISPGLPLQELLPQNLSKYYTYSGSLTTPPCSECVVWIVMAEPVYVSRDQLRRLRKLHDCCKTCGSTDNFRPVCPQGNRSVRASFELDKA